MPRRKKRLLINFVYCRPVGHVIEALKFARGFYLANKNLEIHLILNGQTSYELARACKWINKVYPADTADVMKHGVKSKFFSIIGKNWDYILADCRFVYESQWESELGYFHIAANRVFRARVFYGDIRVKDDYPGELRYQPDSKVSIPLPGNAVEFARRYRHKGLAIALMPGGSAGISQYPDLSSWKKVIERIKNSFPSVRIYLTGVSKSKKGRTATIAYPARQIRELSRYDYVENCYDTGLWNQLALIKKCRIFIAPHTGFGYVPPCVGTPWLAISRGDWCESLFNRMPFYSVLPDVPDYPRHAFLHKSKLKKGEKIPEMKPEKFEKKISDIIQGIKLLSSSEFTYEKAAKLHAARIRQSRTVREAYGSFDGALDGWMQ